MRNQINPPFKERSPCSIILAFQECPAPFLLTPLVLAMRGETDLAKEWAQGTCLDNDLYPELCKPNKAASLAVR